MECLSLEPEQIILQKQQFKITKWVEKDMVKKMVQKASESRYIADKNAKHDHREQAKKGMFHALRILHFGLQLKKHRKIVDFGECNDLYKEIRQIDVDDFDTRDWYDKFEELKIKLEL